MWLNILYIGIYNGLIWQVDQAPVDNERFQLLSSTVSISISIYTTIWNLQSLILHNAYDYDMNGIHLSYLIHSFIDISSIPIHYSSSLQQFYSFFYSHIHTNMIVILSIDGRNCYTHHADRSRSAWSSYPNAVQINPLPCMFCFSIRFSFVHL